MFQEAKDKYAAYQVEVEVITNNLIQRLHAPEKYGKKPRAEWLHRLINDFDLLGMQLLYKFKDDYHLDEKPGLDECIVEYFQCEHDVDIFPLMTIFGITLA